MHEEDEKEMPQQYCQNKRKTLFDVNVDVDVMVMSSLCVCGRRFHVLQLDLGRAGGSNSNIQ